jgi:hypothetical protein
LEPEENWNIVCATSQGKNISSQEDRIHAPVSLNFFGSKPKKKKMVPLSLVWNQRAARSGSRFVTPMLTFQIEEKTFTSSIWNGKKGGAGYAQLQPAHPAQFELGELDI